MSTWEKVSDKKAVEKSVFSQFFMLAFLSLQGSEVRDLKRFLESIWDAEYAASDPPSYTDQV